MDYQQPAKGAKMMQLKSIQHDASLLLTIEWAGGTFAHSIRHYGLNKEKLERDAANQVILIIQAKENF
jgi:hypothetical protein